MGRNRLTSDELSSFLLTGFNVAENRLQLIVIDLNTSAEYYKSTKMVHPSRQDSHLRSLFSLQVERIAENSFLCQGLGSLDKFVVDLGASLPICSEKSTL